MTRVFFDTNVLVYADDASDMRRKSIAENAIADALRNSTGVISTQVLQEYFAVATRKLGVTSERARVKVELFAKLDVVVIDAPLIFAAIDTHRLRALSIWDALIVRAAIQAGCRRLFTEDLQHGQAFEGLRVENPFLKTT